MHNASLITTKVSAEIFSFLKNKRGQLAAIGSDLDVILEEASAFLEGGKRLRAMFLLAGFSCVADLDLENQDDPLSIAALKAAAAVEIFQAAALIHDDIIDESATRRGRPSAHESFAAYHRIHQFSGSAEKFGINSAILLGDLLQSWADELFSSALDLLISDTDYRNARETFDLMRSEVAGGQFLDILEEVRGSFAEHELQLERSTKVLVFKSAKYSVQAPLLIGGAIAGASEAQLEALANFGLPVGVAFQLRDDVLGVFGEEKTTGKPEADDLREGKRTVLVTLARKELGIGPRRVFDELLGSADLEPMQVETMRKTIKQSGALQKVEKMILRNVGLARESLDATNFKQEAKTSLLELAEKATQRDF